MQKRHFGSANGHGRTYGQQLAEIHANVLPGVTRAEEGEGLITANGDLEQGLTARDSLHRNYTDLEWLRERERYEAYLDERESQTLPNAFDLGWKRNLHHLLGDRAWFLPICNTTGDGWHWEPSPKWLEAREELRRQRENQWRESEQREPPPVMEGYEEDDDQDHPGRYLNPTNGVAIVPKTGRRSPSKANQVLGRTTDGYFDVDFSSERPSSRMSMKTLRRRESFGERLDEDEDDFSSEEETGNQHDEEDRHGVEEEWREWD